MTRASMPLSERFYLADAVFVAAVEGDHALLTSLRDALRTPVYPPFLGRRSCPPSEPLCLDLYTGGRLEDVLANVPWQASAWYRKRRQAPQNLPVLREMGEGESARNADVLRDQPVSFDAAHRRHALRTVISDPVPLPIPAGSSRNDNHDPFDALAALEEESD